MVTGRWTLTWEETAKRFLQRSRLVRSDDDAGEPGWLWASASFGATIFHSCQSPEHGSVSLCAHQHFLMRSSATTTACSVKRMFKYLAPFLIGLCVLLLSCKGSFSISLFFYVFFYIFESLGPYVRVKGSTSRSRPDLVWDKDWGSFVLWEIQLSRYHSLERLHSPHWVTVAPLLRIEWPWVWTCFWALTPIPTTQ